MNDSEYLLGQKVKIMDNSISFDLILSFADVMNDLSCSKQQIARRFKLLVEQKQVHIRKEITDINTNNLKILQQKTAYFQQVKSTNKQLKQTISQKNTLIETLSNQIQSLKQQINQINLTLQKQQQRYKRFETHTLEDYKRLEKVQTQYKQLLSQIQEEKNRKNELQRKVDTMKNQKTNWGDRIAYLIQNREKGLMEEYKQEINNLKDILLFYEQDNKSLKQQLLKEKQAFTESKQSYEYLLKLLQQKYGLASTPTYHHFKTQTQENSIKRIDVATQIAVQCYECRKISDLARHFTRKSVSIQTNKDPRKFADNQTQSQFVRFMDKDSEVLMAQKVKEAFGIIEKQKIIYEQKLNQLQSILLNQPSKMQDLKTIAKLHSKIAQKDRAVELMKNEHLTLKSLNTILHSELQSLKMQIKDGNQVRIDSLQFKKKSTTLRMFTEEIDENQNESKVQKYKHLGPQIRPTITNEKRFTRTVELNSTRKTFSHCKSRVTALTPQMILQDSKQRLSDTFRTTNPQSFRWQKFEQKLKNPELFSQSPFVNAVRREKYKKFSSLKKKRHQESEHTINFTVAF